MTAISVGVEEYILDQHDVILSPHAFIFDATNPDWSPSRDQNELYLRSILGFLNALMLHRKHMFVNDIRDALHLRRTRDGQRYGWLGATPIEFQLYEYDRNAYVVDFETEGIIWDSI